MYTSANLNRPWPNEFVWRGAERCRFELCLPALANAHRYALVVKLCDEEASVTELVEWIGLTQPTVSHHLGVLRKAGLVKARHVGQQRLYSADLDSIGQCCDRLVCELRVQPDLAQSKLGKNSAARSRGGSAPTAT